MSLAKPRANGATMGSPVDARAALCDALTAVPRLQVHPTMPSAPVAWDAWPRWAISNYTGGRLGWVAVHEYDVLVVLPAGYEPDTVDQGDALLDQLALVLALVGLVQQAEPVQLATPNGNPLPALRVRVIPHLNT